jgi:ABC-type hemin transport system ATPase subunit
VVIDRGHFDALFVPAEPLANTNRRRISSFALAMHLPTSFGSSEYVEVGGLMLDEATSAIDVATEHKILKRNRSQSAADHRDDRTS